MRVRFDRFVLDTETRELLRGEARVSLSPKAFELLELLVAHRPKAMAKQDLLERLWPKTFVVEKNLPNLIGEIRDALGDDASTPRFIRTVHRFGYAFHGASGLAETSDAAFQGGTASFLLKWADGRVTIREGAHVLGRDPDGDIFLNHPGISRRHARITVSGNQAVLEDMSSKNGTCVGGQRIYRATVLADGDVVTVGSVELTFVVVKTPNSTETQQTRRQS
jgi:DNA-binding winged helix-turn-helix (wHTH) protein